MTTARYFCYFRLYWHYLPTLVALDSLCVRCARVFLFHGCNRNYKKASKNHSFAFVHSLLHLRGFPRLPFSSNHKIKRARSFCKAYTELVEATSVLERRPPIENRSRSVCSCFLFQTHTVCWLVDDTCTVSA